MTRLRFVSRLNPSKTEAGDLAAYGMVTFAPMDALADGLGGLDTSLERPADELADGSYSYFAEGDLLLAKVTPCFENGKKALVTGLPNRIGFATSEVHVIRPDRRKIDPNYLRYLLSSETFRAAGIASMTGAGGLRRISDNAIKDFALPVPDLDTQKAIAAYLDRETARIDQLIAKKERLISVLGEKRVGAITKMLTSGLESQPRRSKDTGVIWLGNVPEHWEVKRLRFICKIVTGEKDTENNDPGGDYPFFVRSDTIERINSFSLDCEAVLTSGDGAGVAKIFHYYKGKFDFHQRVYAFIDFVGIRPKYFFYFFKTFFPRQMSLHSAKSTVDSVRMPFLKGMVFACPPIQEQAQIEAELNHLSTKIDHLVSQAEKSLAFLRQRRAGLITSAVTGQFDIRQKLPAIITKPDRTTLRVIVGAEIVHRHQNTKRFGRIKNQKFLYLAETHAGITELEGNYLRFAAGPYDANLINETERGMEAAGYFRAQPPEGESKGVTYVALSNAGKHADSLKSLLGDRATELRRIIDLMHGFDTETVEAIATLYAVWNDALMDGEEVDDARVIRGVLTEWDLEKEKFKPEQLRHWLDWMKRNRLVPHGHVPRTKPTMTPRFL